MILPAQRSYMMSVIALLALGAAAGEAQSAQPPYPTGVVRLVVGSATGGGSDTLARTIAPKLSDAMGQTWIVDNRPGAGGSSSTEIVARANPDGYTVLMPLNTHLTANPVFYKVAFNVDKDLQPITLLATSDQMLVVHPSLQATTVKELVTLAKQKPGALIYASTGVGTVDHLGTELLKKRAGIDMLHVAYKGGGPASAAVLAGEAQVRIGSVASTINLVTSERLRALAIASSKRLKLVPDLPTVAESGYPGFAVDVWYALLVPKATPKYVVERIRNEVIKVLQLADVQAGLDRVGLNPVTSTPAELGARINAEAALMAGVIKDAGIKAE